MTFKAQFQEEMRWDKIYDPSNDEENVRYIAWLESRLLKAEEEKKQKAWEAWMYMAIQWHDYDNIYHSIAPQDFNSDICLDDFEEWWNEQFKSKEK